jgi:hypothetical protein
MATGTTTRSTCAGWSRRRCRPRRGCSRERGARVEVDAPAADTLLPRLRADRDRLLQVLLNLLSNAAKFVPEGRGEVTVRLRADDRAATVEVQDNGPGVPPDQQQTVFEKFRQGGDDAAARRAPAWACRSAARSSSTSAAACGCAASPGKAPPSASTCPGTTTTRRHPA